MNIKEAQFKSVLTLALSVTISLLSACGSNGNNSNSENNTNNNSTSNNNRPLPAEAFGGGTTSVSATNASAFSAHVANLSDVVRIRQFNIGDDFFENAWIEKTSSTELRDGLGPLFNNNACQDCHVRDGRGFAPGDAGSETENRFSTLIFKAVKTDITPEQREKMLNGTMGSVGDSGAGGQLQQEAIFGIQKEANFAVSYTYEKITFDDGFEVELRRPQWRLENNYAEQGYDFDSDTLFSPRVAPPMIGMGLLELISQSDLMTKHDPDDSDNDGISGKLNTVWHVLKNSTDVGRFGWKAGQPSVRQQAAGAFNGDMGLTSSIFPVDGCLEHQIDCREAPNGNGDSVRDYDFEVSDSVLDSIEFYGRHLAVPIRRKADDNDVLAGKKLFFDAKCDSCHSERFTTAEDPDLPELSNQTIYPYTDLLLHDMGPDLADVDIDNNPGSAEALTEYQATAREWRTSPLWGIGLTHNVNPDATFLHDGRARTIMEAVLWHGGEAEASKNAVLKFDATERSHFLAFLMDL